MAEDRFAAEGYKIIQSVEIADMEIVLAENPQAAQPYMTWRRSVSKDFGAESHLMPTYGSDYLAVLREFIHTQSACADNIGLDRIYRGSPNVDAAVTMADCVLDGMKGDLEGKVVAIRADILMPEYRAFSHQVFLAQGGFGCSPTARGRLVFGANLYTGEHERWNRADIVGVVDESALPAWAQEKLAALRRPPEKESVIAKIREAKAAAKKAPPAERKPKTHDNPGRSFDDSGHNLFWRNRMQQIDHNFTGAEIIRGDTLQVLKTFPDALFGGIITDPPYASGAADQNARQKSTATKYSSAKAGNALPDFEGDSKDQRSWTHWMTEWLTEARRTAQQGAPICLFIDWRQLPNLTDALQWAGWIWRGVLVWDKINSRPQRGRFRQQAEFTVWGSNGHMPAHRNAPVLPGVFRQGMPPFKGRIHQTEKPLEVMREMVKIVEPGGIILDPFAGAGTTVLAAKLEGYPAVGIELTEHYAAAAAKRVAAGGVSDGLADAA